MGYLTEHTKSWADFFGAVLTGGVVLKFIPIILALPAAVWYCIRIYEYVKAKKNGDIKFD